MPGGFRCAVLQGARCLCACCRSAFLKVHKHVFSHLTPAIGSFDTLWYFLCIHRSQRHATCDQCLQSQVFGSFCMMPCAERGVDAGIEVKCPCLCRELFDTTKTVRQLHYSLQFEICTESDDVSMLWYSRTHCCMRFFRYTSTYSRFRPPRLHLHSEPHFAFPWPWSWDGRKGIEKQGAPPGLPLN